MSAPYNPQYPQGYSSSSPVYQQDRYSHNRSPYTPPPSSQHQASPYGPPSGPKYSNAEMASYASSSYAGPARSESQTGANPSYYPPPSQYEHRNRFPTYQRHGTGAPRYYQPPASNWDDDAGSQYSSSSSHSGERSSSHPRRRHRRRHSFDDRDDRDDRDDNDEDAKEKENPDHHDPFWEVRGPGPADGARGMAAVLAGGAAGYWAGHKKGHAIIGAVGGALAAELLEHEYKKHRHGRKHRNSN